MSSPPRGVLPALSGAEARTRSAPALAARSACALLGMASVVPLVGWLFGAARFSTLFVGVALPALALLGAVGLVAHRLRDRSAALALRAGVVGGLLGTLGYDLFRVPFVLLGFRLFEPIESYGLLALDAGTSSALTSFTGWTYHACNGIGFGVAYAAVALHRDWRWGVAFALLLETSTVVTPFAAMYALSGQWAAIGVAYAAHVPYGVAIGLAAQRADALTRGLAPLGERPTTTVLAAAAAALLLWHQPWTGARAVDAEVLVVAGRFHPEWVRVPQGGCARFENADHVAYSIAAAKGPAVLPARTATRICFAEAGVHRVHTDDRPYDGGFVLVDPEVSDD